MNSVRYLLILLLCATALPTHAQLRIDLESGAVLGTNYNVIRIPNSGGTRFNLARDLKAKPKIFLRARLGYTFANRHTISVLYAPLTVRYEGIFGQNVNYNSVVFPAGQPLTAYYQFNSYRLTYRYDVVARERWRIGLGLTAKIRDANVRLSNAGQDTNFDDVGFVPLVNFYVAYRPNPAWTLLLEGDALGSRFGRAEDVFTGVTHQLSDHIGLKAGYRVVEGGANVETIYNFTWINYAAVGAIIQL